MSGQESVKQLVVRIHTADMEGAGTDGDVYVGFGGREFCIDSEHNDFERKSVRVYGTPWAANIQQTQVLNPNDNDPSQPYSVNIGNIEANPVYVRFEPKDRDDNWILDYVLVRAMNYDDEILIDYEGLGPQNDPNVYLKLGTHSGKYLYLSKKPVIIP
jgi:hypothetical protein